MPDGFRGARKRYEPCEEYQECSGTPRNTESHRGYKSHEDAGIMLTGKVIRFDEVRGYGFIAPDGGGEDVFVHANVLGDDKYVFGPGLRVEFEAADGDRGPKAYLVNLLSERGPAPAPAPVLTPVIPPEAVVAPPAPTTPPITPTPPAVPSPPVMPSRRPRLPPRKLPPPRRARGRASSRGGARCPGRRGRRTLRRPHGVGLQPGDHRAAAQVGAGRDRRAGPDHARRADRLRAPARLD